MQRSTSKSVPNVLSDIPLRNLTVESNALLNTLIPRAVDEGGLAQSWSASIKHALAGFGGSMDSGRWLEGLRKARLSQSATRTFQGKVDRESVGKDREQSSELRAGNVKAGDKHEAKIVEAKTVTSKAEQQGVALKELHELTSSPPNSDHSSPKHLLITVSFSIPESQDHDSEFNSLPAVNNCIFLPDTYSFPFFEDEHGRQGEGGTVLWGLDNWGYEVKPCIVGGNFVFHLSSVTAHESLIAVLRLCTYTHLSLILEQNLLSDSHISLQFPPPPPPPPMSLAPSLYQPPPISQPKRRTRYSKASSGIWSFLSKKTEGIFHRHNSDREDENESSPYVPSFDSAVPQPDFASDPTMVSPTEESDGHVGPFASAIRGIQNPESVLSTSPGVKFPLPPLLARLAAQEEQRPVPLSGSSSLTSSIITNSSFASNATNAVQPVSIRLPSTDKAGLSSLLGWEGREARGNGMIGVRGFVRHQGLTMLYIEHVSPDVQCGRPRLVTYRYWARSRTDDAEADFSLGEFVDRTCEMAEAPCAVEGCDKPRERHSLSWICSGMRISADVVKDEDGATDEENIMMWESCTLCGQRAGRARMSDGTFLFSFAKFLELVLWSPGLASPSLCDHTKAPPVETRLNILRHFSWKGRVVVFSISSIRDKVYELRIPKLQIIPGTVPKEERQLEEARRKQYSEEEKQALFKEMDAWWAFFKTRLDGLDAYLQEEIDAAIRGKDLPPLPASDDEDLKEDSWSLVSERLHTPSPQRSPFGRTSSSAGPQVSSSPNVPRLKAETLSAPYPPGLLISINQSRQLLQRLRFSYQKTEDTMRRQAADNPQLALNDMRRMFRSTARGSFKRLTAWQNKHAPGAPLQIGNDHEPEWWQGTCHAIPGGRVLVREGEWGSVISFTLSSLDYQRELAGLFAPSPVQQPPASTTGSSGVLTPNATVTAKTLKQLASKPDPDETEIPSLWEEPEDCTTYITRREHPKDTSALLSLRDVLRNKKSFESPTVASRFSGPAFRAVSPPSAWTQPQVQLNLQAADGQVTLFPEAAEEVERVLGSQYPMHHQAESTLSSDDTPTPTPSSFIEKNIRSGHSASIISFTPDDRHERKESASGIGHPTSGLPGVSTPAMGHTVDASTSTSATSLSSAISHAVRYFLNTGSPPPSRPSSPATHSAPHHGLLGRDAASIDDRPHIKYDWTVGKRLKFSCTVYYAKQFDALRKRCGVDDSVLKSLERTENWVAAGGKSKSNFWKSSDDRFIIKTLVNAWNVADLQVLIDLGPSYFRYMDSTATKPSVLAKLMGFYTVEIKNLETGAIQAKADLLVMENLFYDRKISKIFDLKGIQSRRAKPNGDYEPRTLFDGEWIENQHRSPLLIQPHSKLVLQEAIKADAEFLAKSNIMDYSLLLGIDEERHEIACGLVDTIGSYTFAKTLEYKAKQNLNSGKGKEVTVMPPAEYQSRFANAIEGYFLPCPDKWMKPPRYVDRTTPHDLACVL